MTFVHYLEIMLLFNKMFRPLETMIEMIHYHEKKTQDQPNLNISLQNHVGESPCIEELLEIITMSPIFLKSLNQVTCLRKYWWMDRTELQPAWRSSCHYVDLWVTRGAQGQEHIGIFHGSSEWGIRVSALLIGGLQQGKEFIHFWQVNVIVRHIWKKKIQMKKTTWSLETYRLFEK